MIKNVLLLLFSIHLLWSCQCSGQEPKGRKQRPLSQEQKLERQREFLKKERASIDLYIKDRGLEMKRNGVGLYYHIVKDSAAGPSAVANDEVEYQYSMYLMSGRLLYTGTKKLVVELQDAEIGLHESLKLLGVGDEGLFILPSHLAFGVAGDQKKIPPKTSLVYEIKILNINSKKETVK